VSQGSPRRAPPGRRRHAPARRTALDPASRRASTRAETPRQEVTISEHHLVGRIAALAIVSVPEFGTRASFTLEHAGRAPVHCVAFGTVAAAFLAGRHREGDTIAVTGVPEPRPATASSATPWTGRLRVRAAAAAVTAGQQ
jgi:hypothetical protein